MPQLVEAAGGGYWLVWGSGSVFTTASDQILAARLGPDGRLRGALIEVAAQDEVSMGSPPDQLAVAPLADGGFVAAFFALPRSGGSVVRWRTFDSNGEPASGPVDLPLESPVAASIRVAVDEADRITVIWEGRDDGWRRVYAASFTADGEPLVAPREVGVPVEPDRDFGLPRIARSGHGSVIVWLERATSGEAWIAARKWSPTQGPLGLVARVPASAARKWTFLEVAPVESSPGAFRVYWNPDGPDGLTEPARVRWRELSVAPGPPLPPAPAAPRRPRRP